MAERRGLRRLSGGVWLKLAGLGLGSTMLFLVGPSLQRSGTQPPVPLLLVIGLLMIVAASAAVYSSIRVNLGFPAMVAWYAVGFHALVILVKFVFGPFGLYEVNQTVEFESLGPISDPAGAIFAGGTVLVLYLAAFLILYLLVVPRERRGRVKRAREKVARSRRAVVLVVGGAILVAASGGFGVILVTLVIASSGLEYMNFVFSSSASLLVATFLAAATVLVGLHFNEASARGPLVADAAGVAALLWLGICFIALYHVLWVVYILVLTSIWPLRTVVPK